MHGPKVLSMVVSIALTALFFVAACAPPGADRSDPELQARDACAARATRCMTTPELDAECTFRLSCTAKFIRRELADAVFSCFADDVCETSDGCFLPERAGFEAPPAWLAYESACLARFRACQGEGAPFENDVCQQPFAVANDALLAEMRACVDGPCGEVINCYTATFTELCGPIPAR